MSTDFTKKVLEVVAEIPRGQLLTYADVAERAGSPRAYRAVGSILHRNFRRREWQLPITHADPVPCHRVIRSNGYVGGYARGEKEKEKILSLEGHTIEKHKIKS